MDDQSGSTRKPLFFVLTVDTQLMRMKNFAVIVVLI